jgi:uncharacterized membrane protein
MRGAALADYNLLAGSDLGRISALSDGIFAFAMTVLVLEIHIPDSAAVANEAALCSALLALAPRAATWLLSLMTLGIFWLGQQTQLSRLVRTDRNLSWLHFLFLAVMTALPFSTRLLAEFIDMRPAFIVYWVNVLLAGVALYVAWRYAERAGLTPEDPTGAFSAAIRRRIIRAQALYAVGALVGLVYIPAGIAFIILVQINYVLPKRWIPWT